MREVFQGRVWTASLAETNDLVRPEAMGAYARHRISCVLTVGRDVRPACVSTLPNLCLPVDEQGATPNAFFDLACAFHLAMGPVLVHCNAGVNRSRVFAAALLFHVWHMGLDDAIRLADPPPSIVLSSMRTWALNGPKYLR